jgi:excinuclease ABC subunit A
MRLSKDVSDVLFKDATDNNLQCIPCNSLLPAVEKVPVMKNLVIKGARQHNLQNITLELPRDKLIVVTGVSGSGKSTLAFDTIYAEGQRRYVESLSSYARQFLGIMNKPDVDSIEGLSPAISIEQKTTSKNPRSTVGTVTEIYDYLRLLYARIGVPHCPKHHVKIESRTPEQIASAITAEFHANKMITILAPVIRKKKEPTNNFSETSTPMGSLAYEWMTKFAEPTAR